MADKFFKYKQALGNRNHYYDIGIPLFSFLQPRSKSDKHFVNKITVIHPERFIDFYEHHLEYYFSTGTGEDKKEVKFLKKVVSVCEDEIEEFKSKAKKSRSYIWDDKKKYSEHIEKVESFIDRLKERDQWGVILSENELIEKLRKEIKTLKTELNECRTPKDRKITVREEDEETLIDIFIQLRDLEVKPRDKMLTTESELTWARMICNNFCLSGDYSEINFENTKKYFYGNRKRHIDNRKFAIVATK